jgi:hypothetical protein
MHRDIEFKSRALDIQPEGGITSLICKVDPE